MRKICSLLLLAISLLSVAVNFSGCSDPVSPITNGPHRDFDNPDTNHVLKDSSYYRKKFTDFYNKLGIKVDLSQVKIPDNKGTGFNYLVFVPAGFDYSTLRQLLRDRCRAYSKSNDYNWIWQIDTSREERKTNSAYAFWCLEPDQQDFFYGSNLSADSILSLNAKKGIKTMTCLEYGLYSLCNDLMDSVRVDDSYGSTSTVCTGSHRLNSNGIIYFFYSSDDKQGFTIRFGPKESIGNGSLLRRILV